MLEQPGSENILVQFVSRIAEILFVIISKGQIGKLYMIDKYGSLSSQGSFKMNEKKFLENLISAHS